MSSSFYRKSSENQSKLREFNVGDPADMPNIPMDYNMPQDMPHHPGSAPGRASGYELSPAEREELQRLRSENVNKGSRVTDHAKKRIEILANLGRLTRQVEVDGISFSLRTLKGKEARETTMSIFDCKNDIEASFEIRRQTLARAIYEIDGQPIELAVGGSSLEAKLALIDEMEDVAIIKLYNEFNELRNEVQVKYGLQSEKEVKEVVEDLKK
jgi:hypothetical protein